MTTDFGTALRLFRLRKRLRALQKAYYLTPRKEEAIIPEYFSALAAIRELVVPPSGDRRLHLGCGGHRIEGWINVDISPSLAIDLQANLAGYFPFLNDSIDFIHSEDLIEHLDLKAGRHLFYSEAEKPE